MHTLLARLKNQKSKSSELDKKDSEIPIKNVDENNPQVELNEENVEPQEPSPSETANAENNEEKPVSHTVGETETTEEKSEEKIEQKAAEDTEEVRRASGASKTSFNPPNIGAPEEAKEKITKDSETENAKDQKIKKKRKSKKKEKDNKDGEVEDKKSSVTDLREDKADAKEPNQASKPEEQVDNSISDHREAEAKLTLGTEYLFAIVIHQTDRLKTNLFISHPMVVVHLIDSKTGKYLKKSQPGKPVTYHSENAKIEDILPIMTSPYRSFEILNATRPKWEEILLFNEAFDYVTKDCANVLVIFEVVDFTSMLAARHRFEEFGKSGGWHKIAWGFINLSNLNEINFGKRIRLQLYRTPKQGRLLRETEQTVEVYQWWKYLTRVQYPSTIYVTLKPLLTPKEVPPTSRSMFALQNEIGQTSPAIETLLKGTQFAKLERLPSDKPDGKSSAAATEVNIWDRLKGQPCKIPNKLLCRLQLGKFGCLRLQFSPDGRYLAGSSKTQSQFPIFCYEIPSTLLVNRLVGHGGLAYDINWSSDSELLISASADSTARIWNPQSGVNLAVLPHPTFVYCAKFVPNTNGRNVITAAYDNNLRIWVCDSENKAEWTVGQLLEGHRSYVNTIEFVAGENQLYSGDGQGKLLLWQTPAEGNSEEPTTSQVGKKWELAKDLGSEVLQQKVIDTIKLHPDNRRLFVSTREDSAIQAIDSRIFLAMRRYETGVVSQLPIRFDISPCGSYLFGGTELGTVIVWKVDSGEKLSTYDFTGQRFPVLDIKYHPCDHLVAFGSFGEGQQILLYKYDKSVPELHSDLGQPTTDKSEESVLFSGDYLNYSVAKLLEEHKILLDSSQDVIKKTSEMLGELLVTTPKTKKSELGGKRRRNLGKTSSNEDNSAAGNSEMKVKTPVRLQQPEVAQVQVKALHRYKAQNADEISFAKGDLITLVSMQNPDWWIGYVEADKTGYFPSNYVKKV